MLDWIETHPVLITIIITFFSAVISAIFGGIVYLIKNGITIKKDMLKTISNQEQEIKKLTELYEKIEDKVNKNICAFKAIAVDLRDQKVLSKDTDLKVKSFLEEN